MILSNEASIDFLPRILINIEAKVLGLFLLCTVCWEKIKQEWHPRDSTFPMAMALR
jgi:hypothetical protein